MTWSKIFSQKKTGKAWDGPVLWAGKIQSTLKYKVAAYALPPLFIALKAWYIAVMFIFSYISAISSVIFLVIGAYTLIKNKEKKETLLHFGLLLLSISLWCFANFKADTALTGQGQVLWSNIALIAAYFGSAFHVSFSFALTQGTAWRKSLAYFVVSFTTIPLLILGIGSYHSPIIHFTSPGSVELGSLALVYLVFFIVSAIHTVLILLKRFSLLNASEQSQRIWVLSGLMVMKIGAALFSIVLPIFGIVHLYSATFAAVSVAAASFVAHTFTGSQFWLNQINILALVLFGLWSIPKADTYLRKKTHSWFFKGNYDYLDASSKLHTIVQQEITLKGISKNYLSLLQHIIPHEHLALISYSQKKVFTPEGKTKSINERQLQCVKADFQTGYDKLEPLQYGLDFAPKKVFPISFNTKTIALLVLDSKKSGEAHTSRDIRFLDHVSQQLSVGIQKAELYDKQTHYSQELEKQITKRTQELEQLQKDQEKNMLDISHALQTPLTILHLESESLPKEVKNSIQSTISRVSESIKELLTLTKLENSMGANIFKETVIEEECLILGNYEQIEKVLVNLVENAAKYMPKQKDSHIHISLQKTHSKVVLKVSDNGLGIPPEEKDQIFSRFYRSSQTQDMPGTGLGLAICKEVIHNHNGTITISTDQDETVFIVTLPSV